MDKAIERIIDDVVYKIDNLRDYIENLENNGHSTR